MVLIVPGLDDGVVSLRPPVEADADDVWAACQDPDISRFTTVPSPYERQHAVSWIEEVARNWSEGGDSASFLITDSGTGELWGACALIGIQPDRAEIGYWVKRDARGRGIAVRAVRLVSEWALLELGVEQVDLLTDVRNQASQRVAEKAGFVELGEWAPPPRCVGKSERMLAYSLRHPDPARARERRAALGRS